MIINFIRIYIISIFIQIHKISFYHKIIKNKVLQPIYLYFYFKSSILLKFNNAP